jgi:hypothetical protein
MSIIKGAVKRFALFAVLGVLVATGAASARPTGQGDGTLTVKNADGRIVLTVTGGAIGRFDEGAVTIKDPIAGDGTGPIVTGAEAVRSINDKTTRYTGKDVRFRIIGGKFSITVTGTNIQLSVIGTGTVTLKGTDADEDGTYSVNGGPAQDFPDFLFSFVLVPPTPAGGG